MSKDATESTAATTEPLWDATFRARLLRQGLSTDEMAEVVELAEALNVENQRLKAKLAEYDKYVAEFTNNA